MELPGLLLGKGIALSLDGMHMQQHRPAHIPGQHQHLGQRLHVVAVHGTHIGKAHVFKHRAAGQQGFFRAVFTSWLMAYTRLPVWLPVSIWR